MATKGAIGALRHGGITRLQTMAALISEHLNIESVTLPQFRDPAYQEAAQLDALALWFEQAATAMGVYVAPPPEIEDDPDYEASTADTQQVEATDDNDLPDYSGDEHNSAYRDMSNKQLRALALERGVDLDGLRSKDELVDALEAADGMTEDEQAAEDDDGNSEHR